MLAASSAVPPAPARVLHAPAAPQPVAPAVPRAAAPVVPLAPVAAPAAVEGAAATSGVAPAAAMDGWVLVNPESSSVPTAESAVVTTENAANGSVTEGEEPPQDVPISVI